MNAPTWPDYALTGPFPFRLIRTADVSGTSGTGHVADGVQFQDGTCVLRWRTAQSSTAVYASHEALMAIHGHGGATVCEWGVKPPSPTFLRAWTDCVQDGCENAPFASVGGLDARENPRVPDYIEEDEQAEYLRGYEAAARDNYGDGWRTCAFGWAPAMAIGGVK